MSKEEIRHPDKAPGPMPYSHAVAVDGWLYVSGQGPIDMKTGAIIEGSIADQTRTTLENIGAILEAGGCTFNDVVKCTCHLRDIADFEAFNKVYISFFPGIRPARTTVQSVLWGGIGVEIDAIARKTS
jgi:2-iminobutanoate/2-iminopropanoate deaminase